MGLRDTALGERPTDRLVDRGEGYRDSPKGEDLDYWILCGKLDGLSRQMPFGRMARVTGLEPAASGVTGRRSNQLSYTRVLVGGKYDMALGLSMVQRKESGQRR